MSCFTDEVEHALSLARELYSVGVVRCAVIVGGVKYCFAAGSSDFNLVSADYVGA